ncbi:MAG: GrdX family protein [Thermovirgaceae bacterium]|nr:GrdX family protein [Synergistales bacterium]HPC76455.1 GrdX family protein [Synergistales bacterium]HRS48923.1 GrdX family protein [Thermovirgaceae bacterium]HRU91256.1 GrdX family protein [Thermovirgaceae bacterium]
MKGERVILSNNPMVREGWQSCRWVDGDAAEVARQARDLVHRGWRFHCHPLAGSIRLLRNPFRTMILDQGGASASPEQVAMAEEALRRLRTEGCPDVPEADGDDYALIDLDLAWRALGGPDSE